MPTPTPNIGLQVPDFNQPNWQVQINYDLNLLDLIFGGSQAVPALTVTNLTVTNFTLANFAALLIAALYSEVPTGSLPGNTFALTYNVGAMIALVINGAIQVLGTDYTVAGNIITTNFTVPSGAVVYAIYFHT
jgi:hypothetical protein